MGVRARQAEDGKVCVRVWASTWVPWRSRAAVWKVRSGLALAITRSLRQMGVRHERAPMPVVMQDPPSVVPDPDAQQAVGLRRRRRDRDNGRDRDSSDRDSKRASPTMMDDFEPHRGAPGGLNEEGAYQHQEHWQQEKQRVWQNTTN